MMRYLGLLILLCVLMMRCSTGPTVAGGTVIPNLVVGNVVYDDSRPAIDKVVTLRSIIITADSDSIITDTTAVTDENGRYEFQAVQKGKYILICEDADNNMSAVIAKFEKKTDSTVIADNMVLRPHINLIGRIVSEEGITTSNVQIFIPGVTGRSFVDTNGVYSLSHVPQGHYELGIISGNTINFLPVTVENVTNETAYVKDVQLELQGSNLYDTYSFYDHTLDYAYSTLPIGYKVGNEPDWYADKDFTGTKYFAVLDDILKEYNPQYTMLFIVGSDGVWCSDKNLVSRLEKEIGFSVFVFEHNKVSISDTAGMDVIYLSSSIIADSLLKYAMLRDVHQPMVCGEDNYYPYMMMTDSSEDDDFGDLESDGFVKIINPDHYIASGLANYVQVIFDEGWVSWGKPKGEAEVIAVFPGNEDIALLFSYDEGAEMAGMKAPARRVGHFFVHTNLTVRNLTEDGWKLFVSCVLWAMGEESIIGL